MHSLNILINFNKKLAFLFCILPVLTLAKMPERLLYEGDSKEACISHGVLAGKIMGARQRGTPISAAMNINKKHKDNALKQPKGPVQTSLFGFALLEEIYIIEAYKRPKFSTDENQINSQVEFENEVTSRCLDVNN